MNETSAETLATPASDGLAAKQLQHVGWAYGLIFLLFFVYAWRATAATRRLHERLAELERDGAR